MSADRLDSRGHWEQLLAALPRCSHKRVMAQHQTPGRVPSHVTLGPANRGVEELEQVDFVVDSMPDERHLFGQIALGDQHRRIEVADLRRVIGRTGRLVGLPQP